MHNPYNYHIPVRDDALFFGREEIIERLLDGLSAPTPLSAAVFGGRRCGKTSLLSKLERLLRADDVRAAGERLFVPCSLDLQRGRPLSGSNDFFLWVLEELGEAWEKRLSLARGAVVDVLQAAYRAEMSKGPVDAFVHAFRALDTRGQRLRLVILMDESEDIMAVEWGDDLRPNLRALLSNSPIVEDVALVLAGSTQMYNQVTERDSPLENILDRHPLPPLSQEATLALARQPNDERLPADVAQEVWRQSGGQPCIAQYVLRELWEELEGELAEATVQDAQDVAETFEERTRHFSTWARTLGANGNKVYRFLAQADVPVSWADIRQNFAAEDSGALRDTLEILYYHGLIQRQGQGRRRQYQVGGRMYRDWFIAAGETSPAQAPPDAAQLRRVITERLDLEEFRTLCADLGVNYDDLGGEGLSGKARELLLRLEKRKRLLELVRWLHRMRPDIAV